MNDDDDSEVWKALRESKQQKFNADRKRFMAQALAKDDGCWTKHTEWHWSRSINGERLDYWPSRKKFQWRGKVTRNLVLMNRLIKGETV